MEYKDIMTTADLIFEEDLTDKSIVDVGCNQGHFCIEAKRRNAKEVIGIENNKEISNITKEKVNKNIKIISSIDELDNKIYDIILLMNVTHHIGNPIQIINDLSKKCKQLIVEFPTISDEAFIIRNKGRVDFPNLSFVNKVLYKIRLTFMQFLFRHLDKHYGIIGVGNIDYHNCFYFNKKSFDYTFLTHNKTFRRIEYKQSPRFPNRLIAFCTIK